MSKYLKIVINKNFIYFEQLIGIREFFPHYSKDEKKKNTGDLIEFDITICFSILEFFPHYSKDEKKRTHAT